tara:strand:+ start:57298 stop:57564 length:267 start_codon:yes stop_codon:yes gene_type:complete
LAIALLRLCSNDDFGGVPKLPVVHTRNVPFCGSGNGSEPVSTAATVCCVAALGGELDFSVHAPAVKAAATKEEQNTKREIEEAIADES